MVIDAMNAWIHFPSAGAIKKAGPAGWSDSRRAGLNGIPVLSEING